MTVAMMRTYRENRAGFSTNDLRPTMDSGWPSAPMDIASSLAPTPSKKLPSASSAGENLQDVVLEKIEIQSGDTQLGGAEFL